MTVGKGGGDGLGGRLVCQLARQPLTEPVDRRLRLGTRDHLKKKKKKIFKLQPGTVNNILDSVPARRVSAARSATHGVIAAPLCDLCNLLGG